MNRIEIKTEQLPGGQHLIKPTGKLDVFSFVEFRKFFEDFCAATKEPMVVVDLSGITYIASSGWSVLLSRRQAVRRLGGDMVICALGENLLRVYDTMKIEDMLPSAPSPEEGAKLLKAPETV